MGVHEGIKKPNQKPLDTADVVRDDTADVVRDVSLDSGPRTLSQARAHWLAQTLGKGSAKIFHNLGGGTKFSLT